MILFKKQLFDLEDKGQGPMKVIMVCDTPPNGHAPTYQLSLTYLERKNVMAWTSKYYLKNNYLPLRSKVIAGFTGEIVVAILVIVALGPVVVIL
jgi:hypothetical protein